MLSRTIYFWVVLIAALAAACSTTPKTALNRRVQHFDGDRSMATASYILDTIRQDGAAYPELVTVRGKPWLRLDVKLLLRLETFAQDSGSSVLAHKNKLIRLIEFGQRYSMQELSKELYHLKETTRRRLMQAFAADDLADVEAQYRQASIDLLQREIKFVSELDSAEQVNGYIKNLLKNRSKYPDEKKRWLRALVTLPAWPFTTLWKKKFERMDHSVTLPENPEICFIFEPHLDADVPSEEQGLAIRYAPAIVLFGKQAISYSPDWDKLGRVILIEKNKSDTRIWIDTSQPTLYFDIQQVDPLDLKGYGALQIVYTYWFPGHPPKKFIDFEAGNFEGAIFRVTLNKAYEPIAYETALACGCYHGVYVDASVEAEARAVYGAPLEEGSFAVEKKVKNCMPMVVHGVIDKRPDGMIRPVLYHEAGVHHFQGMRMEVPQCLTTVPLKATIRTYEETEHQQGTTRQLSMFNDKGLVHDAERLESSVLSSFGMFKAGQPRQHVLQKINFDQAYLDDPDLFDRYLRIPPSVWHPQENAQQ